MELIMRRVCDMEEIKADLVGDNSYIEGFCRKMYRKVDRKNPVT
jgi:hypothetical protein